MGSPRRNRARGTIAVLFAVIAVSRAIRWGHGTPAFVAGVAGGILLVLGVVLLFRKD
ncbi:MAG TPA: hypothetical protein VHF01_13145 [Candidatus Acidoferrum sp.]|nr:hypothetical protein [Candidatus Acidoferrum sp.]